MSRFPPTLPPIPADAPALSPADRAYVAALPEHRRFEAEWTIRSIDAAFARAKIAADERRTDAVEARRRYFAEAAE